MIVIYFERGSCTLELQVEVYGVRLLVSQIRTLAEEHFGMSFSEFREHALEVTDCGTRTMVRNPITVQQFSLN